MIDTGYRCDDHVGEVFPPRCADCEAAAPEPHAIATPKLPAGRGAPNSAIVSEGVTSRGVPKVRISPRNPHDPWQIALVTAAAARYPDNGAAKVNVPPGLADDITIALAHLVVYATSHDPADGDAEFFRTHARRPTLAPLTTPRAPGQSQPAPSLVISDPTQAAIAMVAASNDRDTETQNLVLTVTSVTSPTGLVTALAEMVGRALDSDPLRDVVAFLSDSYTAAQ